MEPRFEVTNEILKNLGRIEAAKALIENAPLVPLWERQFREEAVQRAVHHSTHVEGNPLSRTQAQRVLDGKQVSARKRDIQEIINYRKVIDYIDKVYQDTTKPITEETILRVHSILMKNILPPMEVGRYRKVAVIVKNSQTNQIILKPPQAKQVPSLVKEFLKWLWSSSKDNLSAIIKAGVIHYEVVSIHPFTDGSGRTARALSTLSLYKDRYDVKRFFCLDEYFDQDRVSYYTALKSADEKNELSQWLEYFSQGLAGELERVLEKVHQLSRDAKLKKAIGQIGLNERQERIIMFVENYGRIANKDWHRLFPDISDDTVLRDLKFLIDKKVLIKKGRTKAAYYEFR